MDARERTENSHHHKELKKEEPHDNEGYGRVTFIANALLSEAGGIEREDVVVTIESSGDEADVPGPSGMRNGKTVSDSSDRPDVRRELHICHLQALLYGTREAHNDTSWATWRL